MCVRQKCRLRQRSSAGDYHRSVLFIAFLFVLCAAKLTSSFLSPIPSTRSSAALAIRSTNRLRGLLVDRVRNSCASRVMSRPSDDDAADRPTSVAVIGGGVAGLSCAATLASDPNFRATVFDTGRLRPGGRCSSRLPGDRPKSERETRRKLLGGKVIDHAAQMVTVPRGKGFEAFREQVDEWEARGILAKFPRNAVCDVVSDGKKRDAVGSGDVPPGEGSPFRLKHLNGGKRNDPVMYYAVNGMGSIPLTIASDASLEIKQDVWVSPSNGVKYVKDNEGTGRPRWKVQRNGKVLGTYDRLVIAHNGKCADRLMSRTPAKALHSLLRTNFSPTVPAWGGKRMTLNSIYSLVVALDKAKSPIGEALPENEVVCAFVKNEPNLRFMSCNTRKHGDNSSRDDVEIWTILSSAKFAKKYKGPQENLPEEMVDQVTGLMLEALERSLGLSKGSVRGPKDEGVKPGEGIVLESKLQLWGAAVPLNTWSGTSSDDEFGEASMEAAELRNGFLYDADHGVGACGDWLLDPSIGGAWESGRRLANWMTKGSVDGGSSDELLSVGLPPDGAFQASKKVSEAGIGSLR